MRNRSTHARGFTLLEVLVASIMVAVIVASLAESLHVAFNARRAAMAGTQTARAARLAMDAMGRDFRSSLPPNGVLAGVFTTVGDDDPNLGNNSVTFYDTVEPNHDVPAGSDIQQVTFALVQESDLNLAPPTNPGGPVNGKPAPQASPPQAAPPPNNGEGILVRRVVRNLLSPVALTPVDYVLCRHVLAVNFLFYDGTNWNVDWDSTQRNNVLPMAVQITLQVAAAEADSTGNHPSTTLVRIFALPAALPSSQNTN